jgi:hypothetical protein
MSICDVLIFLNTGHIDTGLSIRNLKWNNGWLMSNVPPPPGYNYSVSIPCDVEFFNDGSYNLFVMQKNLGQPTVALTKWSAPPPYWWWGKTGSTIASSNTANAYAFYLVPGYHQEIKGVFLEVHANDWRNPRPTGMWSWYR